MLPEQKRIQLDGIVQQMVAQKEPDTTIQAVVNDFKARHSEPDPSPVKDFLTPTKAEFPGVKFLKTIYNAGKDELGRAAETVNAFQSDRPTSEKVGKTLGLLTGAAHVVFSPITGLLEELKSAPGTNVLAKTAEVPFSLLGKAGSWLTGKAVDQLPLNTQDKQNIKEPAQEAGALAAQVAGGHALIKAAPVAIREGTKVLERRAEATRTRNVETAKGTTGQILQGTPEDITPGMKALSNIDPTKVKTYQDLSNELSKQETLLSERLDKALETRTETKKLAQLSVKEKAGNSVALKNYVDDALRQLEEYYQKTNNTARVAQIRQARTKAETQGLTIKEINDLAKIHGRELNAFNANGELASGLTKQAAENTRKGLKTTARDLFNDEAYKAADLEIRDVIRTRELADDMVDQVNKLQQKIQARNLGQKVGYAAARLLDFVSGGTLKGAVEALLPRGRGYKTLNALDLEKSLQSNLKQLQQLNEMIGNPNTSEQTILDKLNKILEDSGQSESASAANSLNTQSAARTVRNVPIDSIMPPSADMSNAGSTVRQTSKKATRLIVPRTDIINYGE